ncbi:hypothetical protein DPMN_123008 [Dreissena polymorpha]|uniref:Protein kinase domain-containing protein n=1 Tax=Dreissena polymorpha TaxID=45954 RepID=A0A9D4GTM8_DREPO|nr:hypothetical protein DPMN_123008 [Dreissena polymorpha]
MFYTHIEIGTLILKINNTNKLDLHVDPSSHQFHPSTRIVERAQTSNEVNTLRELSHTNVVKILGHCHEFHELKIEFADSRGDNLLLKGIYPQQCEVKLADVGNACVLDGRYEHNGGNQCLYGTRGIVRKTVFKG